MIKIIFMDLSYLDLNRKELIAKDISINLS